MNRLEELDVQECHDLLRSRTVGRVAFTEHALPAIRPVNYAMHGTDIVLRTSGDGLAARLDGQVVAFEIDDVDVDAHAGWSVVVTGAARVLRDPPELRHLEGTLPTSWVGPDRDTGVWITPGQITGRRISADPAYAEG